MKKIFILFFTIFSLLGSFQLPAANLLYCEKTVRKDKEIIAQQAYEAQMADHLFHLDSAKTTGQQTTKVIIGKAFDRFQFVAAAMSADAKLSGLNSLSISDQEKKIKVRASQVELLELEDFEKDLRVDVLCQFLPQSRLAPPPTGTSTP